jgi:hypothetical protein
LPWDWDGEQIFQSNWPDWIYGGADIIGPVETVFQPQIVDVWIDAGATGTATIGIDIDGAGFQNATVAPGDNSFVVKSALEGLAYAPTVDVQGAGTLNTPWRIRFQDPPGSYTVAISSAGLTGGRIYFATVQAGALRPDGWTDSRLDATTITHGEIVGSGVYATTGDAQFPAPPAGCSAWIVFDGQEFMTPGEQKIVRVIPGGLYWSPPVYLYSAGANATVRLVIRDLYENVLYDSAGNEALEEISLTSNVITQTVGIGEVVIPPGVNEIVYRLGHIGTGNPPPIGMACPSLTEGFPASTVGKILLDLYTDWTTNHAASTFPKSYWVHGDGGFYLVPDFDAVVDSDGNAWTQEESITIKRGERFDKVLIKICNLGYEWRIIPAAVDGYYALQVFNAPNLGMDYQALDTPTIRSNRDVTKVAERKWIARTGAMVEGAEQFFSFADSAPAQAGWGVSDDYSVQLDYDGLTVNVAAVQRVDDQLRKTRSLVVDIADVNQPTFPIPGRTYVAGDTLNFIDPPDNPSGTPERVWSINYARDENGITYGVQLGNQSFAGGNR